METKYGIVGCGNISRFHFNGLAKVGAKILHIADLNEQAAAPHVSRFGAEFSRDYLDVIRNPEVNVVVVLTHGKSHKEICLAALQAGKDVICEKTMTDNARDSREVAGAAMASGRIFHSAYMKRFLPAVMKARELVPQLGTLFSAQVRTYQMWGNFYDATDEGDFKSVLGHYGGAILKCAGSHMLDMMLHLLGRPDRVYATIDYLAGTRFDRKATALFEYRNGMVASFEAAAHPLKRIGHERNAWDECMQINGVNGRLDIFTVQWDHPEYNGSLLVHYNNDTETSTEYRFAAINPFDLEMAHFDQCHARRVQGIPDAVDGFSVDLLIETMERSCRNQSSAVLDWQGL